MSNKTEAKRKAKKLKIKKSGIDTIRLDKKAMAREADAIKIKYMTHFTELLDKLAGAESNGEIFERLVKEYEIVDKVTSIAIGTQFFIDRQKEVLDNIEKIKAEYDTNEERVVRIFKSLMVVVIKPESKNHLHAAIMLSVPMIGHFIGECLKDDVE